MSRKFTKNLSALLFSYGCAICFLFPSLLQAQCTIEANFTASNVYPCLGETVSFTNLTTGGATNFSWFQDATFFSNATSPSRTFNTAGPTGITLIASSGICVDTLTKIVVVNPTINSTVTATDASCNGFSDGSANLSPSAGTPNISLDNVRSTNDYVAANSVAEYSYASGVTVEAWVKPRSNWTTGDGHITAFNRGSGGNRFFVGYNAGLQKFVYFDSNTGNQFQNGGISPRGVWTHIAVTIDATNVVRMYINGVLRKTVSTNSDWRPVSGDLFSIGQEWDLPNTSQHFDGHIDELRVWNTSLTTATVQSNFNNSCASISPTHPNINNLIAYYSMNEGAGAFIFDRSGNENHGDRSGSSWGTPANSNFGCFSAGTGYAYNWSNGFTGEDPSGLTAATYNVTITDGTGCSATNSVTIGEPVPVVVNISSNPSDTVCVGDTTQLTAAGASTYTWSSTGGLAPATGATVSAFPTNNNTAYEVIGIDTNGCADTATTVITVNALPTAAITGTNVICDGDSTTLTATGGSSYVWSNTDATAATTVMPTAATTYTVTVTDGNGCKDTDQVTVNVNALPTVAITGTDSICDGDSTTLTASGGNMYAWSSGSMVAATTVNPTANTTYSVMVTDSNSCSASDSIEVIVNALPVIAITGDDTICAGDTAVLNASGGTMYAWSSGSMVASTSVSPGMNTTYSVVVTTGFGCTDSDSTEVVVNATPTAAISGMNTVCAGDSTLLTATGGGTYMWSNGAMTAMTNVAPAATGNVFVTVTNGDGCTDTDTFLVNVTPQLTATISPGNGTAICDGETLTLTGTGGTSYMWSTGDTTASIMVTPTVATTYTLMVSDGSSCDGTDSVNVTVNPTPNPMIVVMGNTLSTMQSYTTYNWYQVGSTTSLSTNPTYTVTQSGGYYVVVTNADSCSGTDTTMIVSVKESLTDPVSVLVYPNPNTGIFSIQLVSDHANEVSLGIYDMVGKQVYTRVLNLPSGQSTENVNLQNLAKGVYILQVHTGATKSYHKVVVE